MNEVAEALELARLHGVEVEARGEELRLRAPAKPPLELLDALRRHKPEIMAALAAASPSAPYRAGAPLWGGGTAPEGIQGKDFYWWLKIKNA